jgi:hypothetical protein
MTTTIPGLTDTLPWQDGNPKLIGSKDGDIIFCHVFETDQSRVALDFAEAIHGCLYTWVTGGYWNQLSIGAHNADRFLYVVLPPASIMREPDGTWPELIDLPDDPCEEDDDECDEDAGA